MNWINIIDLYGYSIFDNIKLNPDIDKETLINTIMDKCALNEPLYTDYDILVYKINNFFNKYSLTIDRLYRAYTVDYNPIENYDRIETHNTTHNGDDTVKVSPFDSNDFENDSRTENNDTTTVNSRVHGNIGVTTSAQMLTQELDILPKLNIYENIANMFYSEFCIYTL